MGMPKGMKHRHGYATVTGIGKGFREIAEEMTASGKKMNHATARNYFLRAMNKLAKPLSEFSGRSADDIASDVRFQTAVADLLRNKK
tara:strand:- start:461 stop:721 length:261 start_codon:yes stop_codon:yes gene_type:complete